MRWARYKAATTIGEYRDLGGTTKDLKHDYPRGLVKFVDAGVAQVPMPARARASTAAAAGITRTLATLLPPTPRCVAIAEDHEDDSWVMYGTDFAHIARKLPGECMSRLKKKNNISREQISELVQELHLCESEAKFNVLAGTFLAAMGRAGEDDLVKYLMKPGRGYMTAPFNRFFITALWKRCGDGRILYAKLPPSTQHGESYNKQLATDVLLSLIHI